MLGESHTSPDTHTALSSYGSDSQLYFLFAVIGVQMHPDLGFRSPAAHSRSYLHSHNGPLYRQSAGTRFHLVNTVGIEGAPGEQCL